MELLSEHKTISGFDDALAYSNDARLDLELAINRTERIPHVVDYLNLRSIVRIAGQPEGQ